jgi:hypothetical protein
MNRHAALGALNDSINIDGSGAAEWQRRTKPNNSFNRSGMSLPFIRKIEGLL